MLCATLMGMQIQAAQPKSAMDLKIPGMLVNAQVAVLTYIGYSYLSRQDILVENQFPIAYQWYLDKSAQYPNAQLDSKHFVMSNHFMKHTFLLNTANNIYFAKAALQEISYIYKKVLDGHTLTTEEEFALARQEFMLLQAAGLIENQSAEKLAATFAALAGTGYIFNALDHSHPFQKRENNNGIYGLSVMTAIGATRALHASADQFACKHLDTQTLQKSLSLFENKDTDIFFELEKEYLHKHIKTNSTFGQFTQTVVDPVERVLFYISKQFLLLLKSTDATYWTTHLIFDPLHPTPAARAQTIRAELDRRAQEQAQQA